MGPRGKRLVTHLTRQDSALPTNRSGQSYGLTMPFVLTLALALALALVLTLSPTVTRAAYP